MQDHPKNPRKENSKKRLLQAACRLFCKEGIHATGIARIIEESRVSRRALYMHYGSKENLLKAVFEAEASMWFRWFDTDLAALNCLPKDRVLALFDLMSDWFNSKNFYGCVFINAVAEHDKGNSWVQEIANTHREKINAKLRAMVADIGIQDPNMVTEKLSLLIDGTIVTAMITGQGHIAHIGRLAASDILCNAPTSRNSHPINIGDIGS